MEPVLPPPEGSRAPWSPRRSALAAYAAAAVSGLLLALAFPLVVPLVGLREVDPAGRLELVAWVALVPALLAVRAAPSARSAFLRGFVAGLACFYAAIYWVSHAMTAFGGLPFAVALLGLTLLVAFMAAHWGAAFAISWKLRQRLGWPMVVHLPIVWVALELCRDHLFSGFPWANVGYAAGPHARRSRSSPRSRGPTGSPRSSCS